MTSKKLEGVEYTAELRSISQRVLGLAADVDESSSSTSTSESQDVSVADARSTLEEQAQKNTTTTTTDKSPPHPSSLSLSAVKAMRTIIQQSNESSATKASLLSDLNSALAKTSSLQFTQPQPAQPDSKYLKRMERLRLKAEERNYSRLVNNLDTTVADDQTMKSMQYATSVGLNMIVAPISFGAFMYFFSGHAFGWIVDRTAGGDDGGAGAGSGHHGSGGGGSSNVDVRAVIAGVVSGVCMLFIEMTLFVIRSHEMDAAVTKKARRSNPNPFGYDKNKAERTFEG